MATYISFALFVFRISSFLIKTQREKEAQAYP